MVCRSLAATRLQSAQKTGAGMDELLRRVEEALNSRLTEFSVLIPYSRYEIVNMIRRDGRILSETHDDARNKNYRINERSGCDAN